MSLFTDQSKLEVKSIYQSNLAQFVSTKPEATLCLVPNDSTTHFVTLTSVSSHHSNTETYIGLHSENTSVNTAMFDNNSINFGNDTLLKGNLIVFGNIISLGYDVLNNNNQSLLHNYGSSAQKGLHSISQKAIAHMQNYSAQISHDILNHANTDVQHMKETFGIADLQHFPNNMFTANDFNNLFNAKSLDDVQQGTSNRYISNNEYNSITNTPVLIDGKLVASNIITQSINIDGNIHADFFYGDALNIFNVNTELFNTSVLTEIPQSSNLYFTYQRAGALTYSCNEHASNYIDCLHLLSSTAIIKTETITSNALEDFSNSVTDYYITLKNPLIHLADNEKEQSLHTLNTMSDRLHQLFTTSSNSLQTYYDTTLSSSSNYILQASNQLAHITNIEASNTQDYATTTSNSLYLDLYIKYASHNEYLQQNSNLTLEFLHQSNIDASNLIDNTTTLLLNFIEHNNTILYTDIQHTSTTLIAYINSQQLQYTDYLNDTSNNLITHSINSYEYIHHNLHETSNTMTNNIQNTLLFNLSNYVFSTCNANTQQIHNDYMNTTNNISINNTLSSNVINEIREYSNLLFVNDTANSNYVLNQSDIIIEAYKQNSSILLQSLSTEMSATTDSITTDDIPQTTSLYYTYDLFKTTLNTKSLDDLVQLQSSNHCIVNNTYNSNLFVHGNITAQNLVVFGTEAVFNTKVYNSERVEINNIDDTPALKLQEYANADANASLNFMNINNETSSVFIVHDDGGICIKAGDASSHILNVNGTLHADYAYGSGASLQNVNLSDKSTAHLAEGTSNLYFTPSRVSHILTASNILTCNYIDTSYLLTCLQALNKSDLQNSNTILAHQDNLIQTISTQHSTFSNLTSNISNLLYEYASQLLTSQINFITDTCNHFIVRTSNFLEASGIYIATMQNTIINFAHILDTNMSNYITATSNYLDTIHTISLINTSNYISHSYTTSVQSHIDQIIQDHSNLIANFSNVFMLSYPISNYVADQSSHLEQYQTNITYNQSNMIDTYSNQLINFTKLNVSNLLLFYGPGSTYTYRHTYDNNHMHINFKDKKILNNLNTDLYKLSYNASNIQHIYPVLDNFTISNLSDNYLPANSFAFQSTSSTYIYMNDEYAIKKLFQNMHRSLFAIHFVFKTAYTEDTPLYTLRNNTKIYLGISVRSSILLCKIEDQEFYANSTPILTNTWYIVDLIFDINDTINLQIFINLISHTVSLPYANTFLYQSGQNITMYLGCYTSSVNSIYIQDFRMSSAKNTQSLIETISNILYYGINQDPFTNTSNVIIQPVRWLESADYASNYFNPLSRYITYHGANGIGIGKSSQPEATLDIYTDDPTMHSIKTNNPIWVQSGIVTSSDTRIKTNIRDIDNYQAMQQILAIQPKTYKYIDEHIPEQVFGFSAQQIKDVIPNAVSLHVEAIPNVYSKAKLINKHTIQLLNNTHQISQQYVAIHYNNSVYHENIIEILDNTCFRIENRSKIPDTDIFVYGEIVRDFHALDKNYIYSLSVCATQHLYNRHTNLSNLLSVLPTILPSTTPPSLTSNYLPIINNLSLNATSKFDEIQPIMNTIKQYINSLHLIDNDMHKINANMQSFSIASLINSSNYMSDIYNRLINSEQLHNNILSNNQDILSGTYTLNTNIDIMQTDIIQIQNRLKSKNFK